MIISTNTDLFKPTLNPDLISTLNITMRKINYRMIPLKRRWSQSVLHYNQTSKQAFAHRFVAFPVKEGRQDGNGDEEFAYTTAEDKKGPYVCLPILKNVVDNYYKEYQSREYACNVSSIARDEDRFLVQFLQNQTFDTSQFKLANTSAFKDALLKGAGCIRLRLYDIIKQQKQIEFVNDKNNKKVIKQTIKDVIVNKGLTTEYVDIENVYIDPIAKNPKECFISTPYTDLELIDLFPCLKKYIYIENELDDKKTEDIKDIKTQWISNYKIGETFNEWYWRPETMMNFTSNSTPNSVPLNSGASENFDTSKKGITFLSQGINEFNSLWSEMYFGEQYDTYATEYWRQNKMYRLNEYYNWVENRYILYVGDYVLYDGPMLEPFKSCPLQPIYFDHNENDGFFGRSINDHLHAIQIEANEKETLTKLSAEMAMVTFLEVNSDRLESPNDPIEADLLTIIRTKNTQDGENPTGPAIQQVGIQNQGLQVTTELAQKWSALAEQMFPSTSQLNLQMPKEEREYTIRSRALVPDSFLKLNAEQLSKFAYNAFASKLFELRYFDKSELAVEIAPSKVRALVIRADEQQVTLAKQQIGLILQQVYQKQLEQATGSLLQNPNFQKQLEQYKQQQIQSYSQKLNNPEVASQIKNAGDTSKLQEFLIAQVEKDVETFTKQQASQLVPPIDDENMYISMEDINNILSAEKQFLFSFKETKEEVQKNITNLLSIVAQLPLMGYTFDYNKFAKEIVINHGFNPDVVLKEVGKPSELQGMASSKYTYYFDGQKIPAMTEALLKKTQGIDPEQLRLNPDSPALQNLQAVQDIMTNSAISIQTRKQAQQGQNKLAQEGFKATANSIVDNNQPQLTETNTQPNQPSDQKPQNFALPQ